MFEDSCQFYCTCLCTCVWKGQWFCSLLPRGRNDQGLRSSAADDPQLYSWVPCRRLCATGSGDSGRTTDLEQHLGGKLLYRYRSYLINYSNKIIWKKWNPTAWLWGTIGYISTNINNQYIDSIWFNVEGIIVALLWPVMCLSSVSLKSVRSSSKPCWWSRRHGPQGQYAIVTSAPILNLSISSKSLDLLKDLIRKIMWTTNWTDKWHQMTGVGEMGWLSHGPGATSVPLLVFQDFLLFFVGLVHGEVLEDRPDAGHDFGEMTRACLQYIKEDQDNFKRDEVQKIVYMLHHSPKCLDHLDLIGQLKMFYVIQPDISIIYRSTFPEICSPVWRDCPATSGTASWKMSCRPLGMRPRRRRSISLARKALAVDPAGAKKRVRRLRVMKKPNNLFTPMVDPDCFGVVFGPRVRPDIPVVQRMHLRGLFVRSHEGSRVMVPQWPHWLPFYIRLSVGFRLALGCMEYLEPLVIPDDPREVRWRCFLSPDLFHRSMSKGYDACSGTGEGPVTVCDAWYRSPKYSSAKSSW